MKGFASILPAVLAVASLAPDAALALDAPALDYMRELARPDRTLLVMEYIDARLNAATERVGMMVRERFRPVDGTTIRVSDELAVRLGGVVPCASNVPVQHEDYQGTCAGLAAEGLDIELRHASVLLCRAYADQRGQSVQEATCYTYTRIGDALESVDMVEESLVGGGWAFAARGADGVPQRGDLAAAERMAATNGFVLWSMDPVPLPHAEPGAGPTKR